MTYDRRSDIEKELGLDSEKERLEREESVAKETERREKKRLIREKIKNSTYYKVLFKAAPLLDISDALLGFVEFGGDIVSLLVGLTYIHFCISRVRSVRLTMAVAALILTDFMLGAIPLLGSTADVFFCSNIMCRELISGYIDGDKKRIKIVNIISLTPPLIILLIILIIYFSSK